MSLMRFDILTIFPHLLDSPLNEGIIKRARASETLKIETHNIRDYALDKHNTTDDRPFGGGEGMVMKPAPLLAALRAVHEAVPGGHVVLMTPQGRSYNQKVAAELVDKKHLVIICGRYEGVDARVEEYIDDEISIGDYVLTGGELAAMVLVDSVTRLLPGVLGCGDSVTCDTFAYDLRRTASRNLLKHPQYTRPRVFEGLAVPEVLMSGDHGAIEQWRLAQSVQRTRDRRPDLLADASFSKAELKGLKKSGVDVKGLRCLEEQKIRLDIALVHYPVCNKNNEIIGSAVTNLDLHDIARASATYGVDTYYVITPYADQRILANEIMAHWQTGHGAEYNPDRKRAFRSVEVLASIEELYAAVCKKWHRKPLILATSAVAGHSGIDYAEARQRLAAGERMLILFGTGWGLAPEVMADVDMVLPPLGGEGYNHLSVRSAVSIILDRLLS